MMLVARVKWVYRTVISIAVVPRDRFYPTSLHTAFMSSILQSSFVILYLIFSLFNNCLLG